MKLVRYKDHCSLTNDSVSGILKEAIDETFAAFEFYDANGDRQLVFEEILSVRIKPMIHFAFVKWTSSKISNPIQI